MAELCILVCGKTGVGKSTLVNSILGKDVVKTGGPGCRSQSQPGPFSSLSAVTAGITSASGDVEGVTVTVYDSPGLQDGHGKDESYLDQIREVFDQAHLTLYCFEMTTTRWLPSDQNAIELITKKFGMEFWSKAILVLTKANQYQLSKSYEDPNDKAEWDKRCERAFLDIAEPFKEQLKQLLSPSEYSSVDNIPVVAAGDFEEEAKHRELIFVAPGKKHMDYLSELWVQCLKRLPPGISRLAFMQASDLSVAISPNVGTESIRSSIEQLLEVASISSAHPEGTDIRSDLDIIGLSINGTTCTACVDGLTETTPISAHLPVIAVKNICSIPASTAMPCTAFRNCNTLSSTSICEKGVSRDPNTALDNTTSSPHQATTPVTQGRRTARRNHRRSRRKQAERPEPNPSTIPSHSLLPGAADRNGRTTGFMATCKQGIASEPSPAASNATSSTNATPIASSDCTVGKYRRHTRNKRALGLEPNTPVGTSGSTKVSSSSSYKASKDQVWGNSKCTNMPVGAPMPAVDVGNSHSTLPATVVLETDARSHIGNSSTLTCNTAAVPQTSHIASHSVQTSRATTDEIAGGCGPTGSKSKCKPVVAEVSNTSVINARSTHTSTPIMKTPSRARDQGSTMSSSSCKLVVGKEPSTAVANAGDTCTSVNTSPRSCGSSNTLTPAITQRSNAGDVNARPTLMVNVSNTLSNCKPALEQVPNTSALNRGPPFYLAPTAAVCARDYRSKSSSSNCQTVAPSLDMLIPTSQLEVASMPSTDDSQNTILNPSQALPDGQILAGPRRRRRIQLNEEQSRVFVDSTSESLAEITMKFANIGATGGAAIGTVVLSVAAMFVPALALAGPQACRKVGALAGGAIGGTLGAVLGLAIGLWKRMNEVPSV